MHLSVIYSLASGEGAWMWHKHLLTTGTDPGSPFSPCEARRKLPLAKHGGLLNTNMSYTIFYVNPGNVYVRNKKNSEERVSQFWILSHTLFMRKNTTHLKARRRKQSQFRSYNSQNQRAETKKCLWRTHVKSKQEMLPTCDKLNVLGIQACEFSHAPYMPRRF